MMMWDEEEKERDNLHDDDRTLLCIYFAEKEEDASTYLFIAFN